MTQPTHDTEPCDMHLDQEMTMEQQLDHIAREQRMLRADVDYCIRYVQMIAVGMGLKEQCRELEAEREKRLRGGESDAE